MSFFRKTQKNTGYLAISFTDDGIYAAHIIRSTGNLPSVELLAFFPGEKSSLPMQLERLAKELQAQRYNCSTLLTTGEYQLLSVDAPNVPAEELKTAIRWRLKDMIDFHIDDATIDVVDIPADKNAPTRSRTMYAVVARNQLIEQRQVQFTQAKIPLSVIDIPEMAQRNIAALMEPENRGLAMLSFDEEGGLFTVTHGGELYLSRRLDVRLTQLNQADEARRIETFDRITLELQRSLDHFDRQFHFITLAKLVIAPMEAATGLQDYLAANLYLPIESLNLDTLLDISKTPELRQLESQQRFFLTLGAALRHEEKVL